MNKNLQQQLDSIKSERDLVQQRLDFALEVFYANPIQETIIDVFKELVHAVIYKIGIHVPFEIEGTSMIYQIIQIDEFGWAYAAYTSAEETEKSNCKNCAVMPTRTLFEKVAEDDLKGVMINPQHVSGEGALLFLSKDNVKQILNYANDIVKQQPEEIQKILLENNMEI